MTAANTRDCFVEVIGRKVVGALFDAFPRGAHDDLTTKTLTTKTLVFDDGRGLTIASNGSFWIENADDVSRAVERKRRELERVQDEIRQVLLVAGEQP